MRLAEAHGVGTRDLKRIEVLGTPIEAARFDMRSFRAPVKGVAAALYKRSRSPF